jgi:hypothetical protein
MCSSNFSNMLLKLIEMLLFTYFSILGFISSLNINKKNETDSELGDLGSAMVDSQMTIDGHICLALSEQEEVVVPRGCQSLGFVSIKPNPTKSMA